MTTLTVSELREKAIRERLSKITPGPWKAHAYNSGMGTLVSWGDISKGQNIAIAFAQADHAQGASNGQFLAAARDDVPYLLAELKSAEQQRDQARELLLRLTTIPAHCSAYPCWCDPSSGRDDPHTSACLAAKEETGK